MMTSAPLRSAIVGPGVMPCAACAVMQAAGVMGNCLRRIFHLVLVSWSTVQLNDACLGRIGMTPSSRSPRAAKLEFRVDAFVFHVKPTQNIHSRSVRLQWFRRGHARFGIFQQFQQRQKRAENHNQSSKCKVTISNILTYVDHSLVCRPAVASNGSANG